MSGWSFRVSNLFLLAVAVAFLAWVAWLLVNVE